MTDQPPGPSRETFLNLRAMLPSFIKGMKKRKLLGKGHPVLIPRPTKVCAICGALHGDRMARRDDEIQLVPEHCKRCQDLLTDGYIAFTCGLDFVFQKPAPDLQDFAGQIVKISPHVMNLLKLKFKVQQKRKNNGDN